MFGPAQHSIILIQSKTNIMTAMHEVWALHLVPTITPCPFTEKQENKTEILFCAQTET